MHDRHQDWFFQRANGPLADRLQRRDRRRALVLCTIASALLVGGTIYLAGDRPGWVLLAMVPYVLSAYGLTLSLRGIFELEDGRLDEHQIAVRNRAHRAAHGATLLFLILVVTVVGILDLDRRGLFSLASSAFLIGLLAPRFFAAWLLEDLDDGE